MLPETAEPIVREPTIGALHDLAAAYLLRVEPGSSARLCIFIWSCWWRSSGLSTMESCGVRGPHLDLDNWAMTW